jgi:hypothetical protein
MKPIKIELIYAKNRDTRQTVGYHIYTTMSDIPVNPYSFNNLLDRIQRNKNPAEALRTRYLEMVKDATEAALKVFCTTFGMDKFPEIAYLAKFSTQSIDTLNCAVYTIINSNYIWDETAFETETIFMHTSFIPKTQRV